MRVFLLLLALGLASCADSKSPPASQGEPAYTVAAPATRNVESEKSPQDLNSPVYLASDTSALGLPAAKFHPDWVRVLVFDQENLAADQVAFATQNGLEIQVPEAFEGTSVPLRLVGGVYEDALGARGDFLALIANDSRVVFCEPLSPRPSIVFFKPYDGSYLVGTAFYSNFQKRLMAKGGGFALVSLDAEE